MNLAMPRAARAAVLMLLVLTCAGAASAQPAPPAPGTTSLDTNGDGTQDVAIRRLDTDGNGTTDRVHIDANRNGVIDAGERAFDNVVGYLIANGMITIVEDTGTERVRTVVTPLDKNGDFDCDDDGEIVQSNSMADSQARLQLQLAAGQPIDVTLNGVTRFAADLNAIAAPFGRDQIPVEIVALILAGGSQPMTVRLSRVQRSLGGIIETANETPGNLDARHFWPTGTVDSVFDVFVEIDFGGRTLVPVRPLQLVSLWGSHPPDPAQKWFLANGPLLLVDNETGAPAGDLASFDWTPHLAPLLPCACTNVDIVPIIKTEGKKGHEVVVSPAPSGDVSGADDKVYDIEIEIEWKVTLTCGNGDGGCEGKYVPSAKSEGWRIDNKPSAPTGLDSHEAVGADKNVICTEVCDATGRHPAKTRYKVSVKKGAGGKITKSVTGVITLSMTRAACPGTDWKMVIVFEADVKNRVVGISNHFSNWDGDEKPNGSDKNPLDATKD